MFKLIDKLSTPLTSDALIEAIQDRKHFEIYIAWANETRFTPKYQPNFHHAKVGSFAIVWQRNELFIVVINKTWIDRGNRMVKVKSIPMKQDMGVEPSSLPSINTYWYNVKATLIS